MRQLIRALGASALVTSVCLAATINPTSAGPGQAVASTCAGLGIGGSLGPAYSEDAGGISGKSCSSMVSGVGGVATAASSESGTMNGFSYSGDATAQGGTGIFKIKALGSGSASTGFSGSSANAGWNESFTLSGGGANGTQGIWMVPIHVDGTLHASGRGALGRLQIAVYRNDSPLTMYAPNDTAYNLFENASDPIRNGKVLFSWDSQMVVYQVTDYGAGDPNTHLDIAENRTLWFAIPFTWGTAFEAGFYANAMAGQIASGGTPYANSTAIHFENTMSWGGQGYVVGAGGGVVTEFSVGSASGFDYSVAVTPEPSSFVPVLLVLAVCGVRARREAACQAARRLPIGARRMPA